MSERKPDYTVRWYEWNGEEYVPNCTEYKSEAAAVAHFDRIEVSDDIPQAEVLCDGELTHFKDFWFDDEHLFGL